MPPTDKREAEARRLDRRYHGLCALADDPGTTDAESDTARAVARTVGGRMRELGYAPGSLYPGIGDLMPEVEQLDTAPTSEEVPTVTVHGNRRGSYPVAAAYMCRRCGHGRATNYCALCHGPAVETPLGTLGYAKNPWRY